MVTTWNRPLAARSGDTHPTPGSITGQKPLRRSQLILVVETLLAYAPRTTHVQATSASAALGLLGVILGMAGAVIAGMVWARSGLTATAGGVPVTDIVILLIGLLLAAANGGWLFAGHEPMDYDGSQTLTDLTYIVPEQLPGLLFSSARSRSRYIACRGMLVVVVSASWLS